MFLISLFLAALMGYAIQRGATCTVAAMEEIVCRRRANRLAAMLEASLWVASLFLVAQVLGFGLELPRGYAVGAPAIVGGVLLGAGAYVNQACVFGAIARLGSGEWTYLATPIGFFLGARVVAAAMPDVTTPAITSPLSTMPGTLAFAAVLFMVYRLLPAGVAFVRAQPSTLRDVGHELGERLWQPGTATAVIGVAFFFLLVFEGAWAYTDVLSEAAHGIRRDIAARGALLLALLAGAMIGGWTAGRLKFVAPNARMLAECLSGGTLMGAGSALIPGSNDGLILLGLPLLFVHAWVAFCSMAAVIGILIWTDDRGTTPKERGS